MALIGETGYSALGMGHSADSADLIDAVLRAINSPLLGGASPENARQIIVNIVGLSPNLRAVGAEMVSRLVGVHAGTIATAFPDLAKEPGTSVVMVLFGLPVAPQEITTSRDIKKDSDILILWDPTFVDADEYVSLVKALGDLVRGAGAEGIEREKGPRYLTLRQPVTA
jgi:hypothetical protein